MKTTPLSAVSAWSNNTVNGKWCPTSLDVICPHCGRMVNLPLHAHHFDNGRKTIAATCRCPACSEMTFVWVIEPGDGSDPAQRGCAELCVHPSPVTTREPLVAPDHLPEPALERAYYSAIRAYNHGLWDACATSCRKTLEGIVHNMDEEGSGPLFQRLKTVFASAKLLDPLVQVADSLRKAGNFAAHFNLERETDQEVAQLMLDLLDYFLEYTFVLQDKATELEKRLESQGD